MIQHYQDRQQSFDTDYLLYTLDWICKEWAEELDEAPDWLRDLHQHWELVRQGGQSLDLQFDQYLTTPERKNIVLYQMTMTQVALLFGYPEYVPLEELPPLPSNRPQPIGLIYSQQIAATIDQLAQLLDPNWGEDEGDISDSLY